MNFFWNGMHTVSQTDEIRMAGIETIHISQYKWKSRVIISGRCETSAGISGVPGKSSSMVSTENTSTSNTRAGVMGHQSVHFTWWYIHKAKKALSRTRSSNSKSAFGELLCDSKSVPALRRSASGERLWRRHHLLCCTFDIQFARLEIMQGFAQWNDTNQKTGSTHKKPNTFFSYTFEGWIVKKRML